MPKLLVTYGILRGAKDDFIVHDVNNPLSVLNCKLVEDRVTLDTITLKGKYVI